MSLLRAFYAGALPELGGVAILDPAESRHLTRVRRARLGDRIQLLDGCGGIASGPLIDDNPDGARVPCETVARHPFPIPRLLAVGLPRGGVFEDIIRQAAELGATGIQPILAARAETRLDDPDRLAHKQTRWHAAALEACKQSGNPWLPEVHPPLTLDAWLTGPRRPVADWQKFVAALTPDARPLAQLDTFNPKLGSLMAVGPEGDFTPEEYARLAGAGFKPIRLPGYILRVETACATALALLGSPRQNS
jgi:16S rRNA (uracil1498-N3)-methyltransferase